MIYYLHHHHYHLSRMGEIKRLLWAHAIGMLGAGLVTLFIPIYLLKNGYTIHSVLGFLALEGVMGCLGILLLAKLLPRFGTNRLMAVGVLVHAVQLSLLLTLEQFHWPLWLIAAAYGLFISLYSPSMHMNFSKGRAHEKTGTQVSGIQIIKIVATALAPALGGILATTVGISWVYGAAIGLQIMAAAPLLAGEEIINPSPLDFSKLSIRKIRPHLAAMAANATTTVAEVVTWPILVYFLIPSYAGVGVLSSVIAISSIGTAFYVGRHEAKRPRRYLSQGVTLASISDIFRLLAQNAGHVFGVNFIGGVGNSLYFTPFMSTFYENADKQPRREYILVMDIMFHLSWAAFFGILLAASFFLSPKETLLVGILISIPANFVIRKIS